MSIGTHILDAIQNIQGFFKTWGADGNLFVIEWNETEEGFAPGVMWNDTPKGRTIFNASRVARTANETRPANISSYLCIKY
jgi:hypothetical protein